MWEGIRGRSGKFRQPVDCAAAYLQMLLRVKIIFLFEWRFRVFAGALHSLLNGKMVKV